MQFLLLPPFAAVIVALLLGWILFFFVLGTSLLICTGRKAVGQLYFLSFCIFSQGLC